MMNIKKRSFNIQNDSGILEDANGNIIGSVITENDGNVYVRSSKDIMSLINMSDVAYNPLATILDTKKTFVHYRHGNTLDIVISTDYYKQYDAFGFFIKTWYKDNAVTTMYVLTYVDLKVQPIGMTTITIVPFIFPKADKIQENSHSIISSEKKLFKPDCYSVPLLACYEEGNITKYATLLTERADFPLTFDAPLTITDGFSSSKAKEFREKQLQYSQSLNKKLIQQNK